MAITTTKQAYQHFSGSGNETVNFARTCVQLFFNIDGGSMEISFDGGSNYMTVGAGTYHLQGIWLNELHFQGANSFSGVGIAL